MVQVPINFPCISTLWATDLIDSVSDNSSGPVELGIRKACTGSGFPENKPYVYYTSSEWGLASAEVWARDAAGNTTTCFVNLQLYDVAGSCDPIASVFVQFADSLNTGVGNASINLSGFNCLGDSLQNYPAMPLVTLDNGWWMTYGGLVTPGYTTTLTPSKHLNPTNGLTTKDLADIQSHILGNTPFGSPFQILAADANQDGKASVFDIILLRKLLLGLIQELPHGKSWRFVPHDFNFPGPGLPFPAQVPEAIVVPANLEQVPNGFYFIGVKIGDVNFSADPKL